MLHDSEQSDDIIGQVVGMNMWDMKGKWDHFPETVGKGKHICPGCAYAERAVMFVGISTVREVKGTNTCNLEPNQRRAVSHVIACEAFQPKAHTISQMKLDRWLA